MKPANLSRIRTQLLLNFPFWGTLAMRLKIEATTATKTFSVDGTTLRYNPEFAATLREPELIGVMAHEVQHCALGHPYRRGARDLEDWNKAADYVINSQLIAAGFTLPKGALIDPQYDGMSTEAVYAKIRNNKPQPPPQPQGGGGQPDDQGEPQPNPTGDVQDAPAQGQGNGSGQQGGQDQGDQGDHGDASGEPETSPDAMTEHDWKIAAEQAARVAKAAGKLPGNVDRELKNSRESVADWRAILREFIDHTHPSDYSWMRPNRRFIHQGLYLPGVHKENTGVIAVAVDTSGSIGPAMLECFAAELTAILNETKPEALEVIYCDASVNGTTRFEPDQGEVTLKPCGGGGTAFQPVFDHVSDAQIEPRALVYLTDLENGGETLTEPDYPVLWVTPEWSSRTAEFGETVRLRMEE